MVKATDAEHVKVATQTMLIVDSQLEIKIGVGLNSWPPAILGRDEIQIADQVANYLGVGIGDEVTIYADLGKTIPDVSSPRAHLIGAILSGMPNVTMNFEQEYIQHKDMAYPFSVFGLGTNNTYAGYNLTFTVKSTYDTPDGKFSQIYGNVALIDCGYLVDEIIDELYVEAAEAKRTGNLTEEQYLEVFELLTAINDYAR
jgi:hypothetical protein